MDVGTVEKIKKYLFKSGKFLFNRLSGQDRLIFAEWLDGMLNGGFIDNEPIMLIGNIWCDFCNRHPFTKQFVKFYKADNTDNYVTFLLEDGKTELKYYFNVDILETHIHDFIDKEEYSSICDLEN